MPAPWTWGPARKTFILLLEKSLLPIKLCLMIDCLGEFDGGHEDLASLIENIAATGQANVKLCVSSRPFAVFKGTFIKCRQLKL